MPQTIVEETIRGHGFTYPSNSLGREPAWISALKKGRPLSAIRPLLQSTISELADATGVKIKGWRSPVLLSGELEPGTYGIENGFIVVSEETALARAIDCDGDQMIVDLRHPQVTLKYPQTTLNPILWNRVDYVPKPKLSSYSDLTVQKNEYDEAANFTKAHAPVDTGLQTWTLTNVQLWDHRKLPPLQKVVAMFTDPIRYEVIELQGLKTARKDHISVVDDPFENTSIQATQRIPRTEYMVTLGPNSAGRMNDKDVSILTDWISNGYLSGVFRRFQNLDFVFIPSTVPDKSSVEFEDHSKNLLYVGADELIKIGALALTPVQSESGYSAYSITLKDPKGNPVVLQEAKRSDLVAGFEFIVYPTFGFVGEKPALLSITRLINEALSQIKNLKRIRNKAHFYSDEYQYHRQRIMQAIVKIAGMYGDMIITQNGKPSPIGNVITKNTVCFRYNSDNPSYEDALKLQEVVGKRVCLSGGKSKNPRVHKYILSRDNGTPVTSNPNCHPRRAGNMRAQLLQAQPIGMCRVAVLLTGSDEQALCTRQGKEKQKLVYESLSLVSPVQSDKTPDPIIYKDWSGNPIQAFAGKRKDPIEIGKIIDPNGFKCQLRPTDFQVEDEQGNSIDFILPPQVIKDKGLDAIYFPKATVQKVKVQYVDENTDGSNPFIIEEELEALVFEQFFFRSGDPAENINPGKTTHIVTGVDSLPIRAALALTKGETDLGIPFPEQELLRLERNMMGIHHITQELSIESPNF